MIFIQAANDFVSCRVRMPGKEKPAMGRGLKGVYSGAEVSLIAGL